MKKFDLITLINFNYSHNIDVYMLNIVNLYGNKKLGVPHIYIIYLMNTRNARIIKYAYSTHKPRKEQLLNVLFLEDDSSIIPPNSILCVPYTSPFTKKEFYELYNFINCKVAYFKKDNYEIINLFKKYIIMDLKKINNTLYENPYEVTFLKNRKLFQPTIDKIISKVFEKWENDLNK